jgi:hypothetical protein
MPERYIGRYKPTMSPAVTRENRWTDVWRVVQESYGFWGYVRF